jgi:hypothetical protein
MPGSVVVADLAAGAAEGLRLLETLLKRRLRAFVVVVASCELADLEWPARELGAAQFVNDTLGGEALAQCCRQLLIVPGLARQWGGRGS